jgi:hypothetical protein
VTAFARSLAASFALAAVLASAPRAAAVGTPVTEVAKLGAVEARLSYTKTGPEVPVGVRLTILRNGAQVFATADSQLSPGEPGSKSVRVLRLDRGPEPEVLVSLYTRGAHCCWLGRVYRYVPASRTYALTARNFADPGFILRDLTHDGLPEFVTADARFAYEFTSFAFSAFPPGVFSYRPGRFVNITRRFRGLIAADARRRRAAYNAAARTPGQDVRGVLAAYVADEYLLGQPQTGWSLVQAAMSRGYLSGSRAVGPWPARQAYTTALKRFLARTGYAL